ncbi:MAG: NAD kinase [Prolixibacteraceae bacterium]|nr:NAD kinase [Prolixibacteraceae bacterium]
MKVAVFGTSVNGKFLPTLKDFFRFFDDHKIEVHIYRPLYAFLISELDYKPEVCDFFESHVDFDDSVSYIFSVGGDGTFLQSFLNTRSYDIPLVGVNSGRLGFLADISPQYIHEALTCIFQGKYNILERTVLEVELNGSPNYEFNFALNEMTVLKTDSSSMININSWINGQRLNSVWADGLILATPTGSTAYSLSVGGPIISPDSENFVINFIAPHNLTVRPIVFPDNSIINLRIEGRGIQYLTSLDSRSMSVDLATTIIVKKAGFKLKTLHLFDHDFYQTLRSKLMWGIDNRN